MGTTGMKSSLASTYAMRRYIAVSRVRCRSLMVPLNRLKPSIHKAIMRRFGTGLKFTMLLPGIRPWPSICRAPVTGRVHT